MRQASAASQCGKPVWQASSAVFVVKFISIWFLLGTVFKMAQVLVPVHFTKICTYCKAEFDSQMKLEDHHYEFHDDGYYYSSEEEGCSSSEDDVSEADLSDVFIDDEADADFNPDDDLVKRKRKAKRDLNSKLKKKIKKGKSIEKCKSVAAKSIVKEKQVC